MTAFGIIAFVLVLGLASWRLGRDWLDVRRTGMSAEHPVCARCLYALGGWVGPTCPECGADAREMGVRTGARTPQTLVAVLVGLLAITVVGPVSNTLLGRLCAERDGHIHASFSTEALPDVHASIRTGFFWRRFPRHFEDVTTVAILRAAPGKSAGWHNGRWSGAAPVARQTFDVDDPAAPPARDDLRDALAEIAGETAPPAVVEAAADDLASYLALWPNTIPSDPTAGIAISHPASVSAWTAAGSGIAVQAGTWRGVSFASIGLVLVTIAVGLPLVRLVGRPGWRPAKLDEWAVVPEGHGAKD